MLERVYNKFLDRKTIEIIKNNEKYKKMFVVSIFFLNLSIYSIPLLLFHSEIIRIPKEVTISYTKFLYNIDLLRIEKEMKDNMIIIREFIFLIDQQCLGIKSILGVFAIIFATPTKFFKRKIKYFLIVLPIVFFLNIIRIYSTIYLFYFLNLDPHLIHDILWGILNSFLIVIIWYNFYKKVKDEITLFS